MIHCREDRFIARNSVADSPNEIHGDGAARYGFGGGLVPGIALLAYACEALRSAVEGWVEGGYVRLRYRWPVYDGQAVSVTVEPGATGECAALRLRRPDGVEAASGVASLSASHYSGRRPELRRRPDHDAPVPLTGAHLLQMEILRPISHAITATDVASEFAGHGLDPGPYIDRGVAPVACVAQSYFQFSDVNFVRLGPSLLVESELLSVEPVALEAQLTIRGRIDRLFSRSGRRYMTVEVGWFDHRDRILVWELQTSIYDLG